MVKKETRETLQNTPLGVLFQEFIVYLVLLQNYAPIITSNCETFAQFAELLDWFDSFNKSFTDDKDTPSDTSDELAWPKAITPGKELYFYYFR